MKVYMDGLYNHSHLKGVTVGVLGCRTETVEKEEGCNSGSE